MYECSYDEMNESFRSLPQCKGFNIEDYLNNYTEIILLKYNAQQKYTFNSDNFKKSIKDFLNCTNLLSKYDSCLVLENNDKDSFFWGIECWKNILQSPMVRRHFSLLLAHSKMWEYRYQYFSEKEYLNNSDYIESIISDLSNTAKIALNLYLKESMRKNKVGDYNFERIFPLLKKCEALEYKICEYFLSHL